MQVSEINSSWKSLELSGKKLFIANVYTESFSDSLFFHFRNKIIRNLKPDNITTINLEFKTKYIRSFIDEEKKHGKSFTVHSAMLEKLRQILPNNSLVLIIDLDAFPLSNDALKLTFILANKFGISGNAQRTNCIENGEHIFIGPSYMCIDIDLLRSIDTPWDVNKRSDVGEEISWHLGTSINRSLFLPFKTIKPPIWSLKGSQKVYGIGTSFSYEEMPIAYHHFFSRDIIAKSHFLLISFIKYQQLVVNSLSLSSLKNFSVITALKKIAKSIRSSCYYLINKPF